MNAAESGPSIVHIAETPYASAINIQPTPILTPPCHQPPTLLTNDSAPSGLDEDGASAPLTEFSTGPRLYAFHEVRNQIKQNFHTKQINNSFVCDMIALYLKGQKILYTEAKTYCELRLSFLMLPAILITATCSILSPILKDYEGGTTAVSALNGFTAFLLAVVNFLKLDAKAEAHRTAAYKFDKLQSALVFKSGRNLFTNSTDDDLNAIIMETEKSVRDIKETDPFVLPEGVRHSFPTLYGTNIFAEIKKVQNKEMELIHELWSMYNETNILDHDIKLLEADGKTVPEEKTKLAKDLEAKQKEKLNQIINIKNEYQKIDTNFENELTRNQRRCIQRLFWCCGICKT
jgi:hypothetical protein